jgi:hypothetical protein
MIKKCHKQDIFVDRIQRALGVSMGNVSCKIVDQGGMAQVMEGAGWSRNDANGVVGFQVGKEVFVLNSAPWTVLHELVHRAGVNSDRLNRFVAEGLTEAIAAELKASPDEHRPTYPAEVSWVKGKLLPALGMTAVQLGRVIAQSQDPPKDLARLMAKARPTLSADNLEQELQPQRPNAPSFNRAQGEVTRTRAPQPPDAFWREHMWRENVGQEPKPGPTMIAGGLMVVGAAVFAYGLGLKVAQMHSTTLGKDRGAERS